MASSAGGVFTSRHHGYLGTVLEFRLEASAPESATRAEYLLLAEVTRLEQIFNVYDPSSELSVWRRTDIAAGSELRTVLDCARSWEVQSGGAFSSTVSALRDVWQEAAERGVTPARNYLADTTYDDRAATDLNAIAKGWIVDRLVDTALDAEGISGVTVNAGGDLLHTGSNPLRVGIENPHRVYDNTPPIQSIELGAGAVATSGGARRGWQIGGDWYSHVIDPRTGWPVDHVAQATVIAPSAAAADAIATILTVLEPGEAREFADSLDQVGYLTIDRDGATWANALWQGLRIS